MTINTQIAFRFSWKIGPCNREKQVPASKAEALFLFHTDTCSLFLLCPSELISCNGFLNSRMTMIYATFYDAIRVEMSDF